MVHVHKYLVNDGCSFFSSELLIMNEWYFLLGCIIGLKLYKYVFYFVILLIKQ